MLEASLPRLCNSTILALADTVSGPLSSCARTRVLRSVSAIRAPDATFLRCDVPIVQPRQGRHKLCALLRKLLGGRKLNRSQPAALPGIGFCDRVRFAG